VVRGMGRGVQSSFITHNSEGVSTGGVTCCSLIIIGRNIVLGGSGVFLCPEG